MQTISSHLRKRVLAVVRQEIYSGFFKDIPQLAEDLCMLFQEPGTDPETLACFIEGGLQDTLHEYRAAQYDWPTVTDCDRLDAAFDELQATGIVTRQHFWCGSSLAFGTIGEEMELFEEETGRNARGYLFYTEQDTYRALDGGDLFLFYGSTEATPEADHLLSHEILRALERHGLIPRQLREDSGTLQLPVHWQRRQPARAES
jgi:hypothetical protein